MSRVRRDKKGLYIKFRNAIARPIIGQPSPLAPRGTYIRESALVEVKLFLGDSRRLLVKVVTNGTYIVPEGKFTEVWYLDGPVKSPPKKKTGNRYAKKRKTKRPVHRRNVDSNNRSRKKVGDKRSNRSRPNQPGVGNTKNSTT